MSNELINKLDFDLAVKHVINDSKTDFIIDKFGIELLKVYPDVFINKLKSKLERCESPITKGKAEYEPLPLQVIDVPKRNFSLRPGAVPEIIDRLYYQALCNSIAHTIEDKLDYNGEKIVFSYRLPKGNNDGSHMFVDSRIAHNEFISHQYELCDSTQYEYIVETDIANYFEHIYHHNLTNLLEGFGCNMIVVSALAQLLRKWNEGRSYGIPQGLWPSDLLGNAYLNYLDVSMKNENFQYIRYVDDIRVFCESKRDAKLALIKINQTVRDLGLNIQPSKTHIHKRNEFSAKVYQMSSNIEKLNLANENIVINYDSYFNEFEVIEMKMTEATFELLGIDRLFCEAIEEPLNEQDIRFCLNAYIHFKKPKAISFCLDNFNNFPHLTSYFINYLTSLEYSPEIAARILHFLKSEDNLYYWQEMWLLRYFHLASNYDASLISYLTKVFLDNNKPVATRSIAVLIIGKIGNKADIIFLKEKFKSTESTWIKRAIILAVTQLPEAERNHVYGYWKKQSWCFELATKYVINNLYSQT